MTSMSSLTDRAKELAQSIRDQGNCGSLLSEGHRIEVERALLQFGAEVADECVSWRIAEATATKLRKAEKL